ncbi:HTH_Tnp_Tc3_2 domain-containing protein [Trichonephila clavipes]|nr:HTH_Tnp_Tc3_2 domain-containing protein [Trichonephila clavipes]
MALYRSPLTVMLWPSLFLKKYGPMILPAHKADQTKNPEGSKLDKNGRQHYRQVTKLVAENDARGSIAKFPLYHHYNAGRCTVLLVRWIVRKVPLEIAGSSGHEKVPTRGKLGLERPGRPRGKRIEGSCASTCGPTVTRSTIRADVDVAIVPQTISRHLAEANHKSKCPFRALPLTPEHWQLRLQ